MLHLELLDRTQELRVLGYESRHLGPTQLPTDHAVIFSHQILSNGIQLEDIEYKDNPEFKLGKGETLEMTGFRFNHSSTYPISRYFCKDGKVVLAKGMKDLWKKQNDEPLN
jgi:ribosome biogenesis SPOUT family RNA methylase Rps3